MVLLIVMFTPPVPKVMGRLGLSPIAAATTETSTPLTASAPILSHGWLCSGPELDYAMAEDLVMME